MFFIIQLFPPGCGDISGYEPQLNIKSNHPCGYMPSLTAHQGFVTENRS